MPLMKLWNSICGRRQSQVPSEVSEHVTKPPTVTQGTAPLRNVGAAKSVDPIKPSASPTKSTGVLSMSFGGPHGAVAKLAKKSDPNPGDVLRVLEIGVEDGHRCLAVVAALVAQRTIEQLQYSVIDTFEMGDGPITMRDFNKLAREASVKPQLFPMPIDAGLMRLAHTLGAVDLILDSGSFHATADGAKLLSKVMHTSSVLLSPVDGKWRRVEGTTALGTVRKAA